MTDQTDSNQKIFRKAAMAKMRSPEQLDALLPVTSSQGWIALVAIGLFLGVVLFWGFCGTILRTTTGQGVIMRDVDTGIYEVSGSGTGVISKIHVQVGDEVVTGQVIAHLDLSQLEKQIEDAELSLKNLRTQSEERSLDETQRLHILEEKLANQTKLYERGLVTKSPMLETKNLIYEVKTRARDRDYDISTKESSLRELKTRLEKEGEIRTMRGGRVTEVAMSPGNFAQAGRPLVRIESLDGKKEALIYVPLAEGKKVHPGMTVRVSPSTVKPEEYGYILGKVTWVSRFPVTRDYLGNELGGNELLVETLLKDGSAIELVAELELDSRSPSGFKWSSSKGPDVAIESGTLCTASVVVERVRPITLLVPFLKKQLGIL